MPSCLGGGDLDGDVYNVVPLDKVPGFRSAKTCLPSDYEPAQKKTLTRPSTMEDVAEFVMEYINSDVGSVYSFCIAEITHHRNRWLESSQLIGSSLQIKAQSESLILTA